MMLLHRHQSKSKEIFSGEDINAGVVIYFLMKVHAIEGLWFYFAVSPPDIPISCSFFSLDHPAKFLCNFLYDRVLCVWDVNDYFFVFEFLA